MAEASSIQLPISLLTNCKLTICDKIPCDGGKLYKFLTDTLEFKIIKSDPLVIEKDDPSQDDINKLLDALKVLHPHTMKDDSFKLEPTGGNVTCESLVHASSLQAENEVKQLIEPKKENFSDDDSNYEVSLQQGQGSDDDLEELTNFLRGLTVNNESNDQDRLQENNLLDNLSGNTTVPVEVELNNKVSLLENGPDTEKQKTNSQDRDDDKKQVEKTQQEYLCGQDIAEPSSACLQVTENIPIEKESEIKYGSHRQKQDSRDMEQSNKREEKLSTDTQVIEKSCRQSTDPIKCGNSAESSNEKMFVTQGSSTRQEIFNKQDNVTEYSSSEGERKNKTDKQAQNSKDVEENQQNREIQRTHTKITDVNDTKHTSEMQRFVTYDDAKISKECNVKIFKGDKKEDHNVISSDLAYRADPRKIDFNCLIISGVKQPNHVSLPAVSIREANKKIIEEDKNEDPEVISREITCKQRAETEEGHVHMTSSVQNIDQLSLFDISNHEQLHKQKEDTSADVQISTLKDNGSKTKIFKQRELEKSEISSGSNTTHDKTDSSDSDAESHDITYSMKASSLDGIKTYFQDSSYDKYYDDVKNEGSSFTFRLNSCDERDVLFFNRLKKLKVEDFEFDHKDEKNLTSVVKELKTQISGLYVDIKDNKVHIVGLKDDVTSARKKLPLLLRAHDPKTHHRPDMGRHDENTAARAEPLGKNIGDAQRNHKTQRSQILDNEKLLEMGLSQKSEHDETRLKEKQSCRLTHGLHSQSSLPCDYPKHKASTITYSEDSWHSIFTKDHNIYRVISERSTLKVEICQADITKLKVDCIVNAANKRLQHFGGVAKAISMAAGPALKKECEDFTFSGNRVAVTDIFMSTGGQMPAKYVMHAVGPKWDAYDDQKKPKCFEDLRHTVLRCLVEAGRRGFTSIALPSISAAIFKVPKEECARCYMEAVKHYDIFIEQQTSSLHNINFVDVDDSMITVIKEHFQKNWAKPCDPHIVQKDCDFAKIHLHSASKNPAKKFQRSPDRSKLPSSSAAAATKTPGTSKSSSFPAVGNKVASSSELRTERSSAYQIGKFTLRTDSRPAFNHSSDITITVGKPFDKLSSIRDFSVSSNKEKRQSLKSTYKLFNVSKPKSKQQRQVCALLPEPDNTDNIKEAFENLGKVIQSPNHNIFMQTTTNVVITSSILYEEPENNQNKGKRQVCDRKKVGNFAKCLFDYLDEASKKTGPKMSIIVVGSEDALQCIHKVIESRDVSKISPEVNPSSHQGASSVTSTRRQSSDYQETYSTKHSSNFSEDSPMWTANEATASSHRGASGVTSTRRESSDYPQTTKHAGNYPKDKQNAYEGVGTSVDLESCEICYEKNIFSPVSCCNKNICNNCEMKMSSCPFCRKFWKILTGDQPPGTMSVSLINDHADGYEGMLAWEIKYKFLGGLQMEYHPNPGKWYDSMERRAFLPATDASLQVLILLRVAFLRKLTFTIGRSLTTDRENSVVWNDIHHKTRLHGGSHGYPDSSYLHRVTSELANKGVVFGTFTQSERFDIERFHEHLWKFGHFYDV